MKEHYQSVKEFMLRAGQECPLRSCIPIKEVQDLRIKLHTEESVIELTDAYNGDLLPLVLDSVADSLVVVFGTAIASGFTYEQVELGLREAMRSNMTKFIDGHRRADGKWIKGPSFSEPDFEQFIY